ncbi:MlaD family protein, partial [Mycobacterium sp.]|uniref:MlaD family protein n=1 Tax=Mycobacterium sp. TaxID=1785 RepID=UPI002D4A772C
MYDPPLKTANVITWLILATIFALVFLQFRGDFTPKTQLTMIAGRAGLSMDRGGKVTYNGVEIGRVAKIDLLEQ